MRRPGRRPLPVTTDPKTGGLIPDADRIAFQDFQGELDADPVYRATLLHDAATSPTGFRDSIRALQRAERAIEEDESISDAQREVALESIRRNQNRVLHNFARDPVSRRRSGTIPEDQEPGVPFVQTLETPEGARTIMGYRTEDGSFKEINPRNTWEFVEKEREADLEKARIQNQFRFEKDVRTTAERMAKASAENFDSLPVDQQEKLITEQTVIARQRLENRDRAIKQAIAGTPEGEQGQSLMTIKQRWDEAGEQVTEPIALMLKAHVETYYPEAETTDQKKAVARRLLAQFDGG